MKTKLILIALAMVAALSMVSCKNNKKEQSQEPTQEEVQEMKQALADSVLAEIDAFAKNYYIAHENGFHFRGFELTEKEKLDKPDYLLDPSVANSFVTKSQKINALAIYIMDLGVRKIYDMPLEETKEAIAKLAAEVNYPFDIDNYDVSTPKSDIMKKEYEKCKENGDLASFWQFKNAITTETGYVIAHNPELFYSKITEEQLQQYVKKLIAKNQALKELAKYDDEIAEIWELYNQTRVCSSDNQLEKDYASIESAIKCNISNKEKHIAKRNALLQ